MIHPLNKKKMAPTFFEIRIHSVPLGVPLPFDLFLTINNRTVLFRKQGDSISRERIENLERHGGRKFLVNEEQKALYLETARTAIKNPGTLQEMKVKFIKESAYLQLADLFHNEDIAPTVIQVTSLVEEMVAFISSDLAAASSLMRLSTHDEYTYNHSVDVSVFSIALAKKIFGEDKPLLIAAGLGGFLHDVGKRKVNSKIINKPSKLDPAEWEEMKRHTTYGKQLVERLTQVPEESKRVVHEHHENFNGSGYPRGLKEEEISQLARLVSIADVFDALTTKRPYADGMSAGDALKTMYGMAKGKFDPTLFRTFDKNFNTKSRVELPADFDPCQK